MRSRTYTFRHWSRCAMCSAPTEAARTLGRRLDQRQGFRPVGGSAVSTTVQRCRSCGLVFANPMPVPEKVEDHYDIAPDDYWARGALKPDPEYFAGQIGAFRGLWKGGDRPTALDVGAGVGRGMAALEQAGFVAHGIEPSPSFHRRALEGGADPDRLGQSAVEDADYPPASFDLVTFGAVLEHLTDPGDAIARALEWLRPDGLVHAEVPSSDWLMARLVDLAYRAQGLDYTSHLSPLHPPFHLFEFTLQSFRAHAAKHGYDVVHHRPLRRGHLCASLGQPGSRARDGAHWDRHAARGLAVGV